MDLRMGRINNFECSGGCDRVGDVPAECLGNRTLKGDFAGIYSSCSSFKSINPVFLLGNNRNEEFRELGRYQIRA